MLHIRVHTIQSLVHCDLPPAVEGAEVLVEVVDIGCPETIFLNLGTLAEDAVRDHDILYKPGNFTLAILPGADRRPSIAARCEEPGVWSYVTDIQPKKSPDYEARHAEQLVINPDGSVEGRSHDGKTVVRVDCGSDSDLSFTDTIFGAAVSALAQRSMPALGLFGVTSNSKSLQFASALTVADAVEKTIGKTKAM